MSRESKKPHKVFTKGTRSAKVIEATSLFPGGLTDEVWTNLLKLERREIRGMERDVVAVEVMWYTDSLQRHTFTLSWGYLPSKKEDFVDELLKHHPQIKEELRIGYILDLKLTYLGMAVVRDDHDASGYTRFDLEELV